MPVRTMILPGTFSDGQPRDGSRTENIHHPAYDHPDAQRDREDLRERPWAHRRGK